VLAGIALAFHRARLARALALERLRTEIATDLHDDLGSGLAQIAIQSEVGRRAAGTEQEHAFGEIARLARGLRESIADIVWAVDASRDRLLEVVRRARHVAFNLLDSDGLEVAFTAPEDERTLALELPAALRRHLLLFVKEAVTNVARHARARSVAIEITLSGAELGVRISDDGCGFDTARVGSGHGLTSLSRRARALGAELSLRSEPGAGTEIRLRVPLAGRNRIDMRVGAKPTIG
jgi:signal transduction histidine kinase